MKKILTLVPINPFALGRPSPSSLPFLFLLFTFIHSCVSPDTNLTWDAVLPPHLCPV